MWPRGTVGAEVLERPMSHQVGRWAEDAAVGTEVSSTSKGP